MVMVRGSSTGDIPVKVQLGLAADAIKVTFELKHKDMIVDAWGSEIPVDLQWMLGSCYIDMNLIQYDPVVLDFCLAASMGNVGVGAVGTCGRAGQPLGGVGTIAGGPRFGPGNGYIGVTILSPVMGKPYRFWYCYMPEQPMILPFGTEKSITRVRWRAIPYTNDPWGWAGLPTEPSTILGQAVSAQPFTTAGTGAFLATIWDNLDLD